MEEFAAAIVSHLLCMSDNDFTEFLSASEWRQASECPPNSPSGCPTYKTGYDECYIGAVKVAENILHCRQSSVIQRNSNAYPIDDSPYAGIIRNSVN